MFVEVGSRYETADVSGISHFLEQVAFKSTKNRSAFKLVRDMSKLGTNIMSQASRDHMYYYGEAVRDHLPSVVNVYADLVQNHLFNEFEIQEVAEQYKANFTTDTGSDIMEALHSAAYFNNTLGNPLIASAQSIENFTPEVLRNWVNTFYTANRIVISAVGVDHAEFVALVESNFGGLQAGSSVEKAPSTYTGGELRTHKTTDNGLTHIAIGFESAATTSADIVPSCVLQMMLGGGGSFSSGGPGKGMYSRLFTNVLNRHNWAHHISSFNSSYSDSGIFGIFGMTDAANAGNLTSVIADEIAKSAGPVSADELNRAKNQLKSNITMLLETRSAQVEDLGESVLLGVSPAEVYSKIDTVTEADIQRVATNMMKTAPTLAAIGDVSYVPRYEAVRDAFAN